MGRGGGYACVRRDEKQGGGVSYRILKFTCSEVASGTLKLVTNKLLSNQKISTLKFWGGGGGRGEIPAPLPSV